METWRFPSYPFSILKGNGSRVRFELEIKPFWPLSGHFPFPFDILKMFSFYSLQIVKWNRMLHLDPYFFIDGKSTSGQTFEVQRTSHWMTFLEQKDRVSKAINLSAGHSTTSLFFTNVSELSVVVLLLPSIQCLLPSHFIHPTLFFTIFVPREDREENLLIPLQKH